MPVIKGYANIAIAGLRLLLLAVVFGSLWIRFVAMADDNRINDSGQACMGAFLVYVLTLVGDADRSIWIMLFRRSIMLSCIFVLTAITAVDNTLNIVTTETAHNYGKRVNLDWAILCAFIIVSVIEIGMPEVHKKRSPEMPPIQMSLYAGHRNDDDTKSDMSNTEEERII